MLERYNSTWRIKDKTSKDGKEKKPAGNECRHFLWDKGLFLELLRTRWGVEAPTPAEAELEAGVETAQETVGNWCCCAIARCCTHTRATQAERACA